MNDIARNTATYGNGLQPWDLQKDMPTWGSVFVDARRTDVIEYVFRKKGDKSKQLEDARKALHNIQVIIQELEKEDLQEELPGLVNITDSVDDEPKNICPLKHTLANAKYINYDAGTCLNCGVLWPIDQMPKFETPKLTNGHVLITPETCKCGGKDNCPVCVGGLAVCSICNKYEVDLTLPCINPNELPTS